MNARTTPAAARAALEARLVNKARALGVEAGMLRRRLVFQRLVRRLPDDGIWVVKGGFLLEARLSGRARMTKDLDLATDRAADLGALREALGVALGGDVDGDHLVFVVRSASPLRSVVAGGPGWRLSLDVLLDGRVFDRVRLDVVDRVTEVDGCGGDARRAAAARRCCTRSGPDQRSAGRPATPRRSSTPCAAPTQAPGPAHGSRTSWTSCCSSRPGCCPTRGSVSDCRWSSTSGTAHLRRRNYLHRLLRGSTSNG